MEPQQQAINQYQLEFELHVQKGNGEPFLPSMQVGQNFSRAVRGLENKRQLGALTQQEALWLKQADGLMERIARYGRKSAENPKYGSVYQSLPQVYDQRTGVIGDETEIPPAVFVPNITDEQADEIVAELNRQFEEKVLKTLKKKPVLAAPPAQPLNDFGNLPERGAEEGRNLRDYLTAVKAERPDSAFSDADSSMDLAKLKTTHA